MAAGTRAPDQTDRTKFIGASEAGALVGVDVHTPRFDLWAKKTARQRELKLEEEPQLRRGVALEPIIRDQELPLRDDVEYTRPPDDGEFWLHPNGILGSHPDVYGVVRHPAYKLEGEGVGEIKTVNAEVFARIQEDGLPAANFCQLNTTMGLTGIPWGFFAVQHPDSFRLLVFPVPEMNDKLYSYTEEESERFWNDHVLADEAPNPFPDARLPEIPVLGKTLVHVEDDEEWEELMDEWARIQMIRKEIDVIRKGTDAVLDDDGNVIEEAVKGLEQKIQEKMVELQTEIAMGAGWKFYYRPGATQSRFNSTLFTKLGPLHPYDTYDILVEEIDALVDADEMPTQVWLQSVWDRILDTCRMPYDAPEFKKDIPIPYFRGFEQKEG